MRDCPDRDSVVDISICGISYIPAPMLENSGNVEIVFSVEYILSECICKENLN